MIKLEPGAPYYAPHTRLDLTCPHCLGRLSFIINDEKGAQHVCRCGTWYRLVNWFTNKEVWIYEQPKTDAETETSNTGT